MGRSFGEIARGSGLDRSTISLMLRNRRPLRTVQSLSRIAGFLGVTLDELWSEIQVRAHTGENEVERRIVLDRVAAKRVREREDRKIAKRLLKKLKRAKRVTG